MIERIFGANWRTTLSGAGSAFTSFLTLLAALPYELGDLAAVIPPKWKAKVALAGMVATFLLRVIHSSAAKDARISGNGTLEAPLRKPSESDATRSQIIPLAFLAALGLALAGCSLTLNADFGKNGAFHGGNIGIGGTLPEPKSLRK